MWRWLLHLNIARIGRQIPETAAANRNRCTQSKATDQRIKINVHNIRFNHKRMAGIDYHDHATGPAYTPNRCSGPSANPNIFKCRPCPIIEYTNTNPHFQTYTTLFQTVWAVRGGVVVEWRLRLNISNRALNMEKAINHSLVRNRCDLHFRDRPTGPDRSIYCPTERGRRCRCRNMCTHTHAQTAHVSFNECLLLIIAAFVAALAPAVFSIIRCGGVVCERASTATTVPRLGGPAADHQTAARDKPIAAFVHPTKRHHRTC